MQIKDITKKYSISRKALLIYEEKGLISPRRNASGYREYSKKDITIIQKIILLRKLEFSLEDIENIIKNKNNQLIQDKKKEYDKQIHFIETKRNYLDYIEAVIQDEYPIDEAIDSINDTLELYQQDSFLDMLHFDYNKDMVGLMWLGSWISALLSGKLYLMVMALLMGIVSLIMSLQKIQQFFLRLPMKRIMGIVSIIIGLIGTCYFLQQTDTMDHDLMGALCLLTFFYGITCFQEVKDFFFQHQNGLSMLLFFIGLLIFILEFVFDLSGMKGYLLMNIGLFALVGGIYYNHRLKKIFLDLLSCLF